MSVALFLPTETEAGALAFAAGIDLGRIPCLREYLDEDLARQNLARYPGNTSRRPKLFRVENGVATRVAGDAGRAAPFPPAKPSCGSGKPYPVSEEDSATSRAAADRRRLNCESLLRTHQQEASDAA